jgi:dinuclear metal center YbgI/SA1388 family protein
MTAVPNLADVVAALERRYPLHTAESWDAVGLVVGDPARPVRRVLFAVDPVAAVADEAIAWGADLLVTHHPLFLRAVHGMAATSFKGAVAHGLIRGGVALWAGHTNADAAHGGVAQALAEVIGLVDLVPLVAAPREPMDKIVVMVPAGDAEAIVDALAAAGAGAMGEYARAAFTSTGEGTFVPGRDAHPAIGTPGVRETVVEARVEMVAPRRSREAVVAALRAAHPYEEPAFDVLEEAALAGGTGLGRVGRLAEPMRLDDFAARVAAAIPATVQGVRYAGDPGLVVRRVAVLAGAGDGELDSVRAAGVDAYVTSDLRHHPASEARERALFEGRGTPALVDTAHFASEWPWLDRAARTLVADLAAAGTTVEARVSTLCTDPWTARVGGAPDRKDSV